MGKKNPFAASKDRTGNTANPTALFLLSLWGYLIEVAKSKVAHIEGTCQHFPYQWAMLTGSSSSRAGKLFATITHEPRVLIKLRFDPTVWNHACTTQFAAAMDCFEQFLRYNEKLCPGGWFAWIVDVNDRQGLHFHMVGSLGRVDGGLKIEALTRRWLALTGSTNSKMLRAKPAPKKVWGAMKKRLKAVLKQKRLTAPASKLYGISRTRNAGIGKLIGPIIVTSATLRKILRMLEQEVYARNPRGFRKLTRRDQYSLTACPLDVVNKAIRIAKTGNP